MAIDPKVFKQVRKALGLTQEELADAIGLSRVTINKMERGRLARGIPDEIAERLMALKPRTDVKAAPNPYWPFHNEADMEKSGAKLATDDHLWDNEEEDD